MVFCALYVFLRIHYDVDTVAAIYYCMLMAPTIIIGEWVMQNVRIYIPYVHLPILGSTPCHTVATEDRLHCVRVCY